MRYLVLGVIDGMISAGTLSASLVFKGGTLDLGFALSLAMVVASINALTVFVAEFSHQMREVRELSYKVSLREETRGWTLIHSRALYYTSKSAVYNFVASFLGATIVLIPACFTTHAALYAIIVAVLTSSYLLAGGSWREFIEFALMSAVAVGVGIVIGLTFPVFTA
ncbi:protein of unknown function DUF125, transmembrane [Pyrobaculum islandicum DSM 4184]|uniref:VIT family protein n=1 Tax=Pyrobaculum islandicum (strain DSM 4184 / JCM 9189 / GEO3) TaxID=384616 RepID=A1RTL9_PYRIL|nr:hypothetical protein [Pyrobaculum islandicum]ABL88301.1 protein of unknown function DUF125, transmembrane [Pyrobaculum islandicum DSM 4184]